MNKTLDLCLIVIFPKLIFVVIIQRANDNGNIPANDENQFMKFLSTGLIDTSQQDRDMICDKMKAIEHVLPTILIFIGYCSAWNERGRRKEDSGAKENRSI